MEFQTINLIIRSGMYFGHKRIRTYGISDTECIICAFVNSNSGCSQDDVARGLHMDKTTTAKAMLSLETKGFIHREQDKIDKRKKVLTVTPFGLERISELTDLHDNWLEDVMSCLSKDERKRFGEYCLRVLAAAEKKQEEEDEK